MSDDSASKRTHTEDALLADVLEEIAERIDQGRAVDIEAYVLAYPHCAERLRRLIPAVQLLSRAGESSSQRGDTHQVVEEERPPARELGDFRLLREIGRGGMGVVYEGEQISLRRRVAVKILPLASALDRRHLQRFRNEAAAAAQLEHPNIVGIYGVGCDRGIQFYAMQFIEGYSLAEVLAEARQSGESSSAPASLAAAASTLSASRGTPTSRKQGRFMTAARIMRDAAEALHYAHSVGIIHRDVKPANLMLDAEGKVWVTDFGLAQIETATGLTLTGDLVGTLRYASPEQALGVAS